MAKLSAVYRSRARRVHLVERATLGAEARIAHKGVREGVEKALEVSPLPRTGKMARSVQIRFLGLGYAIIYALNIAPYAPIRAKMTGISKLGGHQLDMNPVAYMRKKYGPAILAVRYAKFKGIAGQGETMRNGR